ncbi:UNVERIFIED_CONTAM: hypothetical protein K2H54_060623 [Gekko kuhli]
MQDNSQTNRPKELSALPSGTGAHRTEKRRAGRALQARLARPPHKAGGPQTPPPPRSPALCSQEGNQPPGSLGHCDPIMGTSRTLTVFALKT